MDKYRIRFCSVCVSSTVLILKVISTFYLRRFADFYAPQVKPLFNVSDAMARCSAIQSFYRLPRAWSQIKANKMATDMESVCNRTLNVDPMDILRTCGHHPLLVSRSHVERSSKQAYLVPNVVHYVYNYASPMTFLMYLSLLSVQRFLQPRYLIIYGTSLPYGDWWNRATAEVDNIYFVNMTSKLPSHIYGKKIIHPAHVADMLRLEISYAIGGIYLDFDVMAFKSFDGLRNYPFTLAYEFPSTLANGIIICQPCPPFILHWIDNYRSFNPTEWTNHSTHLPSRLFRGNFSHLIHVEYGSLLGPTDLHKLFKVDITFNWSRLYSVHVYKSNGQVPKSPDELKHLKSILGQMMRYIYTGKRDWKH